MAHIYRFPTYRFAEIDIFELSGGVWVAGIGLPSDGGKAPRFKTHSDASTYAAGLSAGSGLPVKDWHPSPEAESA